MRSAGSGRIGQVHPRRGLNGVGVQQGRRRQLPHRAGDLVEGLEDSRFVVGQLHGYENDVAIEQAAQALQIDQAVAAHRDQPDLLPARPGRLHYSRVLDRADHDRTRPGGQHAKYRQIVRLRTARGEDDAARLHAYEARHSVS